MNKTKFIEEIANKTNLSKNECILVNDISEESGIFGRKNKDKISSAVDKWPPEFSRKSIIKPLIFSFSNFVSSFLNCL